MNYNNIYFVGIGGIGMSALARYFADQGKRVAGYDRTPSTLTGELQKAGIDVHFEDNVNMIPESFREPETTLVVYTPAIPAEHSEMAWLRENGFTILKRSEILGIVSEGKRVMAVAGTHGKTSTTTLVAWLNNAVCNGNDVFGSAFLGGISRNFGSNLVSGTGDRLAVEADEYDRSFLRLHPDIAAITSVDPDHLDIYGTYENIKDAFSQFVRQIKPGGTLIIKKGVEIALDNHDISVYTYSLEGKSDFYASRIELLEGGYYGFDITCPDRIIRDCKLGIPGRINVENAIAAVAMIWAEAKADTNPKELEFDLNEDGLRHGLSSFEGVKRRFEFYVNTPQAVYMDDYAHHPRELSAAIVSVRDMFPGRKMTAIFQPHLYTRTRDLYAEFGDALSLADEVILLPIYPARELPIEGVDSQMIAREVKAPVSLIGKSDLPQEIATRETDIVVTFGAGDIDALCESISDAVQSKVSGKS